MKNMVLNLYILILASTKSHRRGEAFGAALQVSLIVFLYVLSLYVCIALATENKVVSFDALVSMEGKISTLVVMSVIYFLVRRVVSGVSRSDVESAYAKWNAIKKTCFKIIMISSVLLPFIIVIAHKVGFT